MREGSDPRGASGTSLLADLHEADEAAFSAVAGWHAPILDATLPALSEAASYSRIWMAISAALAAFGGSKGRRAAADGVLSVAATSFLANLVLKLTTNRRRPGLIVPEDRRLPTPASSSFPSGHTASGAAFAGAVGRHYPALWIPLNALAALIGFSRVYTGVHYPGDVVAGWILGKAVASGVDRIDLIERMKRRTGP